MLDKMSWCTIESDPGVFSELISRLGVINVDVEEIYGLDELKNSNLSQEVSHHHVVLRDSEKYGLIFLFKYKSGIVDTRPTISFGDEPLSKLYFAKQVVQDACATQAILSVLLNCPMIDLGDELGTFKSFTESLDYEMRGLSIGNSDHIRGVHNAFARPEPFVQEKSAYSRGNSKDAHHFIAYIPHEGVVYELDGLRDGPIALGSYSGDSWLYVAAEAVETRIASLGGNGTESDFNLMLIERDKKHVAEEQLQRLQNMRTMSEDCTTVDSDIESLSSYIQELEQVKATQRKENCRRKHNYVPFIVRLLEFVLASKR